MGLSDLVREHFGVRSTAFVVTALLVANLGTSFSEFVGIGAAADLLHIPRLLAVPASAILIWFLIVAGSFKTVERAFIVVSLAFLAYPIAALLSHPAWPTIGRDLVIPRTENSFGGIQVVMALIGTTITPYMQLYLQSSVAEKNVRPEELGYERIDVVTGTLFGNIISLTIIVATAAALFTNGTRDITSAADAARALEPVAGSGAELLFAFGLLGACLLAAPVLALTSAYTVTEAMGLPKGVSQDFRDAPVFMGLFTGVIAVSAGLAMIPRIPFTSTLVVIQIINGVVLPVVVLSLLRLTNDRELMGEYRNGVTFNVIGIVTAVVVSALSVILVALTIGRPLFG